MILTDFQKYAIAEVVNIAFGRAAASLSELTGSRILLKVPKVEVYTIDQLPSALSGILNGEVCAAHQIFTGQVSGDALLILDVKGATALTSLLTGEEVESIGTSAKEVLIEVGNILLNACLGTFENMLQVQITFSVPHLHLHQLNHTINTLRIGNEEIKYVILIATSFTIKDSNIGGYLMIVLGVVSLDKFIQCLNSLGKDRLL